MLWRAKVVGLGDDGVYVEIPEIATGVPLGPYLIAASVDVGVGDTVAVGEYEGSGTRIVLAVEA